MSELTASQNFGTGAAPLRTRSRPGSRFADGPSARRRLALERDRPPAGALQALRMPRTGEGLSVRGLIALVARYFEKPVAGSMVVFAVGICRRIMGFCGRPFRCFRRTRPPWGARCNVRSGMDRRTSRQDVSLAPCGAGELVGQAVACAARNGSPVVSMVCMMTASLRATATAARLKPSRSRSRRPHVRRSDWAWLRVSSDVAAS